MASWQIRLDVLDALEGGGHVFADLLEAALDAESVSLHRDEGEDHRWQVSLLTKEKPAEDRIHLALAEAERITGGLVKDITITPLDDRDWLAENRKSFPPLDIGPFWVYGTHIDTPVPDGKIGLCLDAGQAFGSGSHATTSGCLQLMETYLPRQGKVTLADIGCGSGILAMGAAKWNPDAVIIAVDNDQKAVHTTIENAERNNIAGAITSGLSDGYAASLVQDSAPYDLILANILPGPLIAMAADASAAIAQDGILILSGLLENQQQRVIDAHHAYGLECIDRKIINGWAALALRKQTKG